MTTLIHTDLYHWTRLRVEKERSLLRTTVVFNEPEG